MELAEITKELMDEANIPSQYRKNLPSKEEIPCCDEIEKYFEPIFEYYTVPGDNIYVHADNDYKFASMVAAKIFLGFIARRLVCDCVSSMLIKGLVEKETRGELVSGWDRLISAKVLWIFHFGQEQTNDFGRSLSAIIQVLEFRRGAGMPTIISSDVPPSALLSDFKRYPVPLGDLILDESLILDVSKPSNRLENQ